MLETLKNLLMPTRTVISEWVIMAVILLFSLIVTRNLKTVPGKTQTLAELAVLKLYDFFEGLLGKKYAKKYFPLLGAFFIFIVVCNYTGELPGAGELFVVPTSVLAVTAALGIIAFVTIPVCGIRERGWKSYLKSFLKPVAFLLPITVMEQLVRPISLSLRLYGNIYGEEKVTESFYDMIPLVLPWVMNILSLLLCLIQAMVFTMLLAIFIGEAVEEEE